MMRNLVDVANDDGMRAADDALLSVAGGQMALGGVERHEDRARSGLGRGRPSSPRAAHRGARSLITPRAADMPAAEAVFEHAWADMHRVRRRWSLLLGLGFAICLALALVTGQLRLESLLGAFG